MPTKKFLELDSNYRNRNMFPNPAQFEVNISQSGMRNQSNALDPVSYAYPEITFCPNDLTNYVINPGPPPVYPPGLVISYSPASGATDSTFLLAASSSTVLILYVNFHHPVDGEDGTSYRIPTTAGYCVGLSLQINLQDNYQTRRIVGWKYLQEDIRVQGLETVTEEQIFQCTIESPFEPIPANSAIPLTNSTLIIYNPSDLHTEPKNSYIFIPCTLGVPELYCKYILYNITRNNSLRILSFDMDTHLAKVDVSEFYGTAGQWELTDRYVMRKELPRFVGTTPNPNEADPIVNPFKIEPNNIINFGSAWTFNQSYLNNFIAIYYVPPSPEVNINAPTAVAPIILQIVDFIYIAATSTTPRLFTSRAIFKTQPGVDVYSIIVNGRFPVDTYFEILNFSIDNVSPFVYTGTLASQSQATAQEVGLQSLILPNVTLKSGGRIAYYPYIYVEIENTSSSSSGTKNLIYSNNPFTYKAVFKVPITDLNHPSQSPFVKLTGNGMVQTMVFKQNDDMRITIRLPNGDVFESFSPDNFFGNSPNTRLQISAVFSMEKIS